MPETGEILVRVDDGKTDYGCHTVDDRHAGMQGRR